MEEKCKNPETKIKNILPDGVKLEDYSDILRQLKQIKRRKEIQSLNPSIIFFYKINFMSVLQGFKQITFYSLFSLRIRKFYSC